MPLPWAVPAALTFPRVGVFGQGGDPGAVQLGMYAMLFLPLMAGAPSGWAVRPLGVLGWLWLATNIVFGVLAMSIVGLMAVGT